jgi:hypothetical protein
MAREAPEVRPREAGGFVRQAEVPERLPAAGLLGVVVHRTAGPLEHRHGGLADRRCELIDVTGNEKSHAHGAKLAPNTE